MSGTSACVNGSIVPCSHLHKHIPASYLNGEELGGRRGVRQGEIKKWRRDLKEKVKKGEKM